MIAAHHLSGAKEPVCECSKASMMFACSVNISLQLVGHFGEDILLISSVQKRTHHRTFFLLVNFTFHFLPNSDREK